MERLPNELIVAIGEKIHAARDLNSLAQTNRRFLVCIDPILYSLQAGTRVSSDKRLSLALRCAVDYDREETVRKALKHDADGLNDVLWTAAYRGHENILPMLLSAYSIDKYGTKMLEHVMLSMALEGKTYGLKTLLESGLLDPWQSELLPRLLGKSVSGLSVANTEYLLSLGTFDLNVRIDSSGSMPLIFRNRTFDLNVRIDGSGDMPLTVRNHIGSMPITVAVCHGSLELTQLLLATGRVDIESVGPDAATGYTPFFIAVSRRHTAIVRALLATGQVDVNRAVPWFLGRTALMMAASTGDAAMVEMLLAQDGIDVEARDNDNGSALMVAAAKGHEAVVEMLLATGKADIHGRDRHGRTPLSQARSNGQFAIYSMMMDSQNDGASRNSSISSGYLNPENRPPRFGGPTTRTVNAAPKPSGDPNLSALTLICVYTFFPFLLAAYPFGPVISCRHNSPRLYDCSSGRRHRLDSDEIKSGTRRDRDIISAMKTQGHVARLLALSVGSAVANAYAVPEVIFSPDSDGTRGAVASEASECSAIGRDIIAAGGNAVDAMVGTTFCVGVIGMYHSGIGGGGFALVRDAEGNYEAVDFRETAPAAAFEDMYGDDEQLSIAGGLAVGVPGEVLGLEYIHQKYGVLKWRDIMQGAIRVARHGFRVSEDMVVKMNATIKDGKTYLLDDPIFAAEFAPKGELLQEGEVMTRKNLANTLERIANEGSDAFYHGEIAENLASFVQSRNGTLTLEDLQSYTVTDRPVKAVRYRGLDVYGMSSPASGAVALQILKVLERYPAAAWHDDRNLTVHRLAEAQRFAFAYRANLGDPAFVKERDILQYEQDFLSEETIDRIHEGISDDRTKHPREYFPSEEDVVALPESHGTSHIVTLDGDGMAVSLTTTININFGAQIMEPNSGIILNDEMNDFSIPGISNEFGFAPSRANFIRPHKRPLSSMTPLIATHPNGTVYAVLGAAGGSRITSATAQCLWHAVEHNLTMGEVLRLGRLHDQLVPNTLTLESFFPDLEGTMQAMRDKGHEVKVARPMLSAVQAIKRREDGSFEAVGEPRQGNSAGYSV